MDDTAEDRTAIQPVINQIVAYPLKDFDGKMKTKDWSKAPAIPGPKSEGGGETAWVVPEKFFDQLATVLDTVPPLAGRGSSLRAVPRRARCRRQGPGDQAGAGSGRGRNRKTGHRAVPRVETQRASRRQWLEPLDQQCALRRRLLQPHRHGQVEHVRQQADRDAIFLYRRRFERAPRSTAGTATRSPSRRDRSRPSTGSGRSPSTTSITSSTRTI